VGNGGGGCVEDVGVADGGRNSRSSVGEREAAVQLSGDVQLRRLQFRHRRHLRRFSANSVALWSDLLQEAFWSGL